MEDNILRIQQLRKLFHKYDIEAYLIPSTDEYLSEYSPTYLKRLEYISGFTGSNGYILITRDKISFYTDGRYINQAAKELPSDTEIIDIRSLAKHSTNGKNIGYNPQIISRAQLKIFDGQTLVSIKDDLVDQIWTRSQSSTENAFIYPMEYSGESSVNKIQDIQAKMKELRADYHLITDLTSIGWLLNIRGLDIDYSPLLISKLILSHNKVYFFVDPRKLNQAVIKFLPPNLEIYDEEYIYEFLGSINGNIIVDPGSIPISYLQALSDNLRVIHNEDLCLASKAIKNQIEIEGAISAHKQDAKAVIEFLAYFYDELKKGVYYTEYELGKTLTSFRSRQEGYIMDSFPAIIGFQENGAIIHYRAKEKGSKLVKGNGLLLIDSGAHYYGGTTDVTRTILVGEATKEQKYYYTMVLKGHIALALARFPKNTRCLHLDILARQYLWNSGKDYAHGTGHGVGNALSVHEGPAAINLINNRLLKEGMILSNEPGYYLNGKYGIRIENLIYCKASQYENFLEFQNLTSIPYCLDLIQMDLITPIEKDYIKSSLISG